MKNAKIRFQCILELVSIHGKSGSLLSHQLSVKKITQIPNGMANSCDYSNIFESISIICFIKPKSAESFV